MSTDKDRTWTNGRSRNVWRAKMFQKVPSKGGNTSDFDFMTGPHPPAKSRIHCTEALLKRLAVRPAPSLKTLRLSDEPHGNQAATWQMLLHVAACSMLTFYKPSSKHPLSNTTKPSTPRPTSTAGIGFRTVEKIGVIPKRRFGRAKNYPMSKTR